MIRVKLSTEINEMIQTRTAENISLFFGLIYRKVKGREKIKLKNEIE